MHYKKIIIFVKKNILDVLDVTDTFIYIKLIKGKALRKHSLHEII